MSPSLLEVERVRKFLDGRLLCGLDTSERRIALTFDDGPNPHITPKLLDLLQAQGVVATFFVVGRRVRRLLDGHFPAGDHVAGWDGDDDRAIAAPAGLYFYRITAGGRTEVRRLMRVSR